MKKSGEENKDKEGVVEGLYFNEVHNQQIKDWLKPWKFSFDVPVDADPNGWRKKVQNEMSFYKDTNDHVVSLKISKKSNKARLIKLRD